MKSEQPAQNGATVICANKSSCRNKGYNVAKQCCKGGTKRCTSAAMARS
eukprot:CAMPEP_0183577000 /NCGR_PEP_ID=MMETSP0371-20130417/138914_1 /TAXON_ID=268820 /ORGANISM="Peridinium aciculiferum, Strain PAER-2" /LENGTH=48 /DNA_ID= /DNA_START= /DNA_END= /DNA_ORIENTATION=